MPVISSRLVGTMAIVLTLLCAPSAFAGADAQRGGSDVAHGPQRNPPLWVYAGQRLRLVTAQGRSLFATTRPFGRELQANIGFRVMATDGSDGGLWFADVNSDRLFKLSRSGGEVLELSVPSPRGIAVDSRDGAVWTSSYDFIRNLRDVVKFSRDGHELVRIHGFSGAVASISLDERNGHLWVADYDADEVVRLSGSDAQLNGYDASGPGGLRHLRMPGFEEPMSLAANPFRDGDGAGNAWVANRIPGEAVKLAPDGAVLATGVPSSGFEMRSIEVDSLRSEAWAVLVNGNEGVARFSSSGRELSFFRIFTAVPDIRTLKRYELPRNLALDEHRDTAWLGLWVYRRGYDLSGAVIALDRRGRRLQRIAETGPVWDIAIQTRQISIAVRGKTELARHRDRLITVAVLSGPGFDPLQVDVRSARFGPAAAPAEGYDARDVNGDGLADLLLRFDLRRTGLHCGAATGGLTAVGYDGLALAGIDDLGAWRCDPRQCGGSPGGR